MLQALWFLDSYYYFDIYIFSKFSDQIEFIANLEKNSVLKSTPLTASQGVEEETSPINSPTVILVEDDSEDVGVTRGEVSQTMSVNDMIDSGTCDVENPSLSPSHPINGDSETTTDLDGSFPSVIPGQPTVGEENLDPGQPAVGGENQDPLLASYRDILLAHLPVYSNKSSTREGVVPIGPLHCQNVIFRKNHKGGDMSDDLGGGGDSVAIPLSVRLANASIDNTGALRESPQVEGFR